MDAGSLREIIMIEKRIVVEDDIGNQSSMWLPFYKGFASVNNLYGTEYWAAAQTQSQNTVVFTLRYNPLFNEVNSLEYRLLFRGKEYDIKSVDNVKYANISIKIKAVLKE